MSNLTERLNQLRQVTVSTPLTRENLDQFLLEEPNMTDREIKDHDFKLIPEYDGDPLLLVDFIRNTNFIYELYCKDDNSFQQLNHAKLVLTLLTKLKGKAKTATYDKEFKSKDEILNFLKRKYQDTRTRETLISDITHTKSYPNENPHDYIDRLSKKRCDLYARVYADPAIENKATEMARYDVQISHHAVHNLHPQLTDFAYHMKFDTLEDIDEILRNTASHIVHRLYGQTHKKDKNQQISHSNYKGKNFDPNFKFKPNQQRQYEPRYNSNNFHQQNYQKYNNPYQNHNHQNHNHQNYNHQNYNHQNYNRPVYNQSWDPQEQHRFFNKPSSNQWKQRTNQPPVEKLGESQTVSMRTVSNRVHLVDEDKDAVIKTLTDKFSALETKLDNFLEPGKHSNDPPDLV